MKQYHLFAERDLKLIETWRKYKRNTDKIVIVHNLGTYVIFGNEDCKRAGIERDRSNNFKMYQKIYGARPHGLDHTTVERIKMRAEVEIHDME